MQSIPRIQKIWIVPATAISACLIALAWRRPFGPLNGDVLGISTAVAVTLAPACMLLSSFRRKDIDLRTRQAAGLIGLSLATVCLGNFLRVLSSLGVPLPYFTGIDIVSNVLVWALGVAGLLRIPLLPVNKGTTWRVVTDVAITGIGTALIMSVLWTLPGMQNGPRELRSEVLVFDAMAIGNLLVLTLITVRGSPPHLRSAIRWISATVVIDTVYLVIFQYVVGTRSQDVRILNCLFFLEYLVFLYFAVSLKPPADDGASHFESEPLLWVVNPLPFCSVIGVGVLLVMSAFAESFSVVPLAVGLVVMSVLMLTRILIANLEVLRAVKEQTAIDARAQSERLEHSRRLSGGIAHIINNTMTVVHGHAELLREEAEPNSLGANSLDAIASSAYRVSALAGRLELASGSRNADEPKSRIAGLVLLQRDFVNRTVGRKCEVVWNVSANSGNALVSPTDLETILRELISNAGEATLKGGRIEIRVHEDVRSPLPAGVSPIPAEGLYSVLEISDSGLGISASELPHVIKPFYTSRPQSEGRGLGLSIVHGIVAGYGGGLLIDTVPGQGSRVRVYLPVAV